MTARGDLGRRALLVALVVALVGCNAGRAFIATSGDYADYRRVRIAASADERMSATWHYLKTRPEGRYHARLTRYFKKVEPAFFKVRKRSIKGLESYLEALPDGPHAQEAATLLVELKTEDRREELASRQARRTGARLDLEREKRRKASELLVWWSAWLLDARVWDGPVSGAPRDFVVQYRLALPQPLCGPDDEEPTVQLCAKSVEQRFLLVVDGKRYDRTVAFSLDTTLDDKWVLDEAIISGDDLFLRTAEAKDGKLRQDVGPEARAAARALFVTALEQELGKRKLTCTTDRTKPTTVVDCDGPRVAIEIVDEYDALVFTWPESEAGEGGAAPSRDAD